MSRAALLALVTVACVTRPPLHRLAQPEAVAVAWVMDVEQGPAKVQDFPERARAGVADVLTARSLEPREVAPAALGEFSTLRDSGRRFQRLMEQTKEPYAMLVEARPVFFSQLNGRYRWVVYARITAGKRGGPPVDDAFEVPVFVDFSHEREAEALFVAAPALADHAAALLDSFLGTGAHARAGSPAPAGPPGPLYFVLVDRFANGDPTNDGEVDAGDPQAFHGGDLAGVTARIEHLKSLGVGALWLSPPFAMRTAKFFGHGAFHGYWVEDLARVEPRFGGDAALRRLADRLRESDLSLVLDVVLNHVAPDAKLALERPEWFHRQGALTDWADPAQLASRDVHGLPDLAQEREDVYRHLLETSLGWVERVRPAGFRLDAVKHIPLAFWRRYNEDVRRRAGRDFLLLGEMLDGDPVSLARTQRDGAFSAMFDFPLGFALVDVFCRDQSASRLGAVLSQDRLYDDPETLYTLLDNHDLPRVATLCRGELDRIRQALAVQLTARGVPSLTYGTESALTGEKEPENRGDMRFDRTPLAPDISRLLAARRARPSLQRGAPVILEASAERFAYARVTADEAAIVAVNRGATPAPVPLPEGLRGDARDLVTGEAIANLEAAPRGVLLAWVKAPSPGAFAALERAAQTQWRSGARKRDVEVTVTGAPQQRGDGVFVAGSGPELGGWKPSGALGPAAPRVATSLPVGSVVEYKLVVKGGGAEPRWESGENRALFVREGEGPLRVTVVWNRR